MKISCVIFAFIISCQFSFAQCEDFDVEITFTHPTCPDYADGSVTGVISGGTLPYSIFITDVDGEIYDLIGIGETGNYLFEGWYYIDVTDDMGCTFSDSVLLVDPLQINVDDYTLVEPSALEICDGSITINEVSGDYDNLFYSWTPDPDGISGIDANAMMDACAGTYDLIIANEIGCTMPYEFEIGIALATPENFVSPVKIYPYAKGVYIHIDEDKNLDLNLKLMSLTGEILLTSDLTNGENFVEFKGDGVFIYAIVSENGAIHHHGKLGLNTDK